MKWIDTILKDSWATKFGKAGNFYVRLMQVHNFGKAQVMLPLGMVDNLIPILTWLAVTWDIKPSGGSLVSIYIGLFIVITLVGQFLRWLNWMKFIAKFNNEENPQVMEILERLKRIEDKL